MRDGWSGIPGGTQRSRHERSTRRKNPGNLVYFGHEATCL